MRKKDIELGVFVSDSENNMYMIVDMKNKNKNKLMTCIPLISKENRKKTDRYVCAAFCDKLLVVSRPEKFFAYQLHFEKPRMAKEITNKIIEKYKNFNPDLYDFDLPDESFSDGLRNGNPWHGMAMLNNRPKIYKG